MAVLARSRCVEFSEVTCTAETDKAILCHVDGKEVWIPKSQIHDDSEVYRVDADPGELVISEWIAKEKGLI